MFILEYLHGEINNLSTHQLTQSSVWSFNRQDSETGSGVSAVSNWSTSLLISMHQARATAVLSTSQAPSEQQQIGVVKNCLRCGRPQQYALIFKMYVAQLLIQTPLTAVFRVVRGF